MLVQIYLSARFEFRYNMVRGRTEFRFKDSSESEYRVLADYDLNSIYKEIAEQEIPFTVNGLMKLLTSQFVPRYNPFLEHLNNLPKWNEETDYIEMLASTIETSNNDYFKFAFKKWIVALVGSLIDDYTINHTFLVLTGGQGVGKTTWINNLIPKELKDYYYSGIVNPSNSDSKIQLAENMLINIDELQGMRPNLIEELKALITIKEIKIRRPYALVHETYPHRASFAGSTNTTDFLSDITGNRRFLCIEVFSINNNHNILIDNVLAQALFLYQDNFKYWFDGEDIAKVNEHNENFRAVSLEEDSLLKFLEPCSENDKKVLYGTTTSILKVLATYEPQIKITDRYIQRLGRLLNKHNFQKVKKSGQQVYFYKLKSPYNIQGE